MSFWDNLKKVWKWLVELILLVVGERLLNPVIDLVGSLFTKEELSSNVLVLGIVGIIVIISATILGVLLVQRVYRWVKTANEAMQGTKVMIPETQKPEVTQPTSPISREAGTTISITSVSRKPLIPANPLTPFSDRPVAEELSTKSGMEYFNSRKERAEKYPLADLLSQARFRIVLLGGSLETVVLQHVRLLEKILKGGVVMEFLIQDPEWVKSVEIDKGTSSGNLSDGISRTLGVLREIRRKLGILENENCIIKMYRFHATNSGIVIDPDSSEARAIIEFYPYDADAELKPSIVINRKENEAVFNKWWRSFEYVLDNAEEYITPPPKLNVKRAELSPDEEPREIHVRFPNGQERSLEARFYFLTVENAEGKRIKGLCPCIYHEYNMLIVSPYGKPAITVDSNTTLKDFDKFASEKKEEGFLAELCNSKKAKKSVDFPPDKRASLTFALFVTFKDYQWLDIIADTKRYKPIPSKFRIKLAFRTDDFLPYHVATYEINAQAWDEIDVKEVQASET